MHLHMMQTQRAHGWQCSQHASERTIDLEQAGTVGCAALQEGCQQLHSIPGQGLLLLCTCCWRICTSIKLRWGACADSSSSLLHSRCCARIEEAEVAGSAAALGSAPVLSAVSKVKAHG